MATHTPPPYFPQSSLAPPDDNRYRKFKLAVFIAGLVLVLLMSAIGVGIWYIMVKWIGAM